MTDQPLWWEREAVTRALFRPHVCLPLMVGAASPQVNGAAAQQLV